MRRGFTFVEVMIIVVIIGLLAAMVIPAVHKVRANAAERERQAKAVGPEEVNNPDYRLYKAWQKITRWGETVTFEEFKQLREAGFLTRPHSE